MQQAVQENNMAVMHEAMEKMVSPLTLNGRACFEVHEGGMKDQNAVASR